MFDVVRKLPTANSTKLMNPYLKVGLNVGQRIVISMRRLSEV